jgi:hypothetical protein
VVVVGRAGSIEQRAVVVVGRAGSIEQRAVARRRCAGRRACAPR